MAKTHRKFTTMLTKIKNLLNIKNKCCHIKINNREEIFKYLYLKYGQLAYY